MSKPDYDTIIIGGGPAGAVAGIYLSRAGLNTLIIERKTFPRETLCGEFLSLEVTEHLMNLGIFNEFLNLYPNKISTFQLSTENKTYRTALPFDGYSIKRSVLDNFLLKQAEISGVKILQPAEVTDLIQEENGFKVFIKNKSTDGIISTRFLIGAFGKSNLLDKKLGRGFTEIKSGYFGLKFHIKKEVLPDIIDSCIYIFTGHNIYCGINTVSRNEAAVCFLSKRTGENNSVKTQFKKLADGNKTLSAFINYNIPDLDKLDVYGSGNIYFGRKELVKKGIIMIGDAAGVIAPLAGDGIGMAFQSAQIAAGIIINYKDSKNYYSIIEQIYKTKWNDQFRNRTTVAYFIQKIMLQNMILKILPAQIIRSLIPTVISATRN